MSEDVPIGLTLISKIVGLVLIIIGAAIAYISYDPPTGAINNFAGLFVGIGLVVAVVGLLLFLVRGR
ncbi:MAG: hypothetical protein IAX21_06280 [Candidatus Bathyarchaeota archaeon]|nr:hypothetical protein [Candidatus Bathyarchaeum tardum]WGM89441.1 MAG: hypothetical protein NUK63_11150 [Candidatus Bathyarchaeum tardum]WNZ28282.1 MAG: hypothetical protein IAX21_06280 [Candidatus Bathyarchaeota archaeon]